MNPKSFVGLPGAYRAKVIKNLKKVMLADIVVEEVVKKHIEHPGDVIDFACLHFNIQKKDLTGSVRTSVFVRPRQMCIAAIIMLFPNETLKNIGKMFNRDHSSIMYSRDVVKDYIETDPSYNFEYKNFLSKI